MDKLSKNKDVLMGNLLILVLVLSFFFIGSVVQTRDFFTGTLIVQYLIILLPSLLFIKVRKIDLRLNQVSFKQIIYTFFIMLAAYPLAVLLNAVIMLIVTSFSSPNHMMVPIPEDPTSYLKYIFLVGITPGICEEVLFRAGIMRSYKELGKRNAIVYSALFFALFHLNILNLGGPFILGLVLGLIAYKSNSIILPILGHAFNNILALTIGFFANTMLDTVETIQEVDEALIGVEQGMGQGAMALGIVIMVIFTSLVLLINLLRKFPSNHVEEKVQPRAFSLIEKVPLVIFLIFYVIINKKYILLL